MSSLFTAVGQCMTGAIRKPEPGVYEADFVFPPDFLGFHGHFPDNPILPGVAQIMAGMLTVFPEGRASLVVIRRAKFTSMVKPDQPMRVRAQTRAKDRDVLVDVDCMTGNGQCARLKLLVEVPK